MLAQAGFAQQPKSREALPMAERASAMRRPELPAPQLRNKPRRWATHNTQPSASTAVISICTSTTLTTRSPFKSLDAADTPRAWLMMACTLTAPLPVHWIVVTSLAVAGAEPPPETLTLLVTGLDPLEGKPALTRIAGYRLPPDRASF